MPRQLADTSLLSLPSATDDPVERRRLLNILAQRRYRNRKRARLESPESQVTVPPTKSTPDGYSWQSQLFDGSISGTTNGATDFQALTSIATDHSEIFTSQSMFYDPFAFGTTSSSSFPNPNESTDFTAQSQSAFSTSTTFNFHPFQSQSESSQGIITDVNGMPVSEEDANEYMSCPEVPPSAANSTSNQILDHAWDDVPPDSTATDAFAFNDEAYVTIPGLSVVRAHVTILQCMHRNGAKIDIWNPFSISPFYQSGAPSVSQSPPPLAATLPDNYQPTALQKTVKHHPLLDLLPWPSVRSRILHILTLPQETRPQRAKGDMPSVMMQLLFDMKDAGGGLRVWGSNPFDEENWEVGPVFFQKWWWALNSEIVKRSNQIRTQRGEDVLRLKDVSN